LIHRPSQRATVAILVIIVVLSAAGYILFNQQRQANPTSVPSHFTVNGRTFGITSVATNESQWQAGLMNKKVTDATFMLFIFPTSAVYSFWMHNVNSSLDIIWVDVAGTTGHVTYLAADAPGCSLPVGCPNYTPTAAANYVIEAKGGFAEANGVVVGSTIQLG